MLTINGIRTDNTGNIIANGKIEAAGGSTGGFFITVAESSANITANHTITINVNVPTGSKILGCQLRVDTALAVGETWDAKYATGATQSITTNRAVAQNTKVNTVFDANADTDIASGEVDVVIQKNSNPGVDVFTATGNIRAIVYYQAFTAMASL